MSSPMSRTVSRPFGRLPPVPTASSASQAWAPTESSGSVPSYVLQDTPDDTPHAMHPHAAAYVTAQQAAPAPQTPARTRTLRQMTPAERTAWLQVHGNRPPNPTPPSQDMTASTSSAPTEVAGTGQGRSHNYAGQDQMAQDTQLSYVAAPLSPQFNLEDVQMTFSTPSAPAQMPSPTPSAASPQQDAGLSRPYTAGPASRALAAITSPGVGPEGVPLAPELEIVISRPGGQDITLRLFAPVR